MVYSYRLSWSRSSKEQPIFEEKPLRRAIASLSLSAAALIGIAVHEGYSDRPIIPVKGDRLTIGFGDATNVKPTDKTDPVRALIRLGEHVSRFESEMKACIGDVPLHQHEWEAYISWAYNVGSGAACKSTLVKKLKARDYAGACKELLKWDKFQGKTLAGLTKRRKDEYRQCIGVKA
jgi:lysozyme